MTRLNFDAFAKPIDLKPDTQLGEGVRLAFQADSQMRITAQTLETSGNRMIMIRGEERHEDDWLGLEIDVGAATTSVFVTCRYAPAERFFPRVYCRLNGQPHVIDEPDRAAPEDKSTLRFNVKDWANLTGSSALTECRLSLLLPVRSWFALALYDVSEQTDG